MLCLPSLTAAGGASRRLRMDLRGAVTTFASPNNLSGVSAAQRKLRRSPLSPLLRCSGLWLAMHFPFCVRDTGGCGRLSDTDFVINVLEYNFRIVQHSSLIEWAVKLHGYCKGLTKKNEFYRACVIKSSLTIF